MDALMLGINICLLLLMIYFIIGIGYGIYFIIRGASRMDPVINNSKFRVRLLLFPGSVVCWPLLIFKSPKVHHHD